MKKNFKRAFTLVEMLIVIIIIGILMSALLPRLKGAQARARDTARKANISQISTALEMYFNDQGTYPTGNCTLDLKTTLVPQYLSSIPSDPQKGRITYGTKDGGCTGGSYAYTALYRNGAQSGGAVLVANVEAEGRVGNFILPTSTSNLTFNGSKTDNARMGATDSDTKATQSNLNNDDHFSSADVAGNAICKSTTVKTTTDDYGNGCWGLNNYVNGVAQKNQYMVYVRFN